MAKVTKQMLIKKLAEAGNVPKKVAETMFNTLITTIMNSVKKGDKVAIPGFGTFMIRKTKARTGRNPATGETIQIPAKKKAVFRPGKEFKALVK
ncbi:MAG: HU family DNA-binding protein [candidate division WOR-3 bacterium]|nr:HU family DNA-binding protein [candidate division WOR-3 bacterium]MCX7756988.1 HU family DNA-binding protein [candidate division WOR-3 bacterium]MDW7987847.1 HU family DNA-binding protein [candidate division WOR-3 bacterium]